MRKQQANTAAIYCRLSRDDGGDSESNSISTQRAMLQRYAKEHGFTVYGEYVDDGWSGTTFERPNFKRMLADIEDKKINVIICKDAYVKHTLNIQRIFQNSLHTPNFRHGIHCFLYYFKWIPKLRHIIDKQPL